MTIRFKVTRANPARASGYDAPRTFPTFSAAERSARALVRALPGRPVIIDRVDSGKNLFKTLRVACVRADAIGRVWTDLMSWEASAQL